MGKLAELVYADLIVRERRKTTAQAWKRHIGRFERVGGIKDEYGRADG